MKNILYIAKYILIMVLGDLIKTFRISSIYSLPWIILIPFNYLAIMYGIIYPARKKNEKEYLKLIVPLTLTTSIFDLIFLQIIGTDTITKIVLIVTNVIEMIYLLYKEDKNLPENITKHNIDEYFKNINNK